MATIATTPADDPDDVVAALADLGYLADRSLATSLFLAMRLGRPLFLEGDPGVGKTELARVLAAWTGAPLVRLQCHEGIDIHHAIYEWDHARQLLHLRTAEATGRAGDASVDLESELYDERFLLRRPVLAALSGSGDVAPVLLIDEIDRADDEFEAYLLEVLADHAVTIPEVGTVAATVAPRVVLTSNRTRDVHDALKRRCIYHWLDHPGVERETAIVRAKVPELAPAVAEAVTRAVARLRAAGMAKPPGIAESLDWAAALAVLGATALDRDLAEATLGAVVKHREDRDHVRDQLLDDLVS